MLVTILMPVYNGEKFIEAAIDSILAQTFEDFKLLIINDGSTDNTQTIIDSYNDKRIHCIQQQNMGVSRSLNIGLSLIDSEFIRRHDADDISESWMLEWQLKYLKNNKDVAAISTRCKFMTVNGKISPKHFHPKEEIFEGKNIIMASKKHFEPYSPIVHGAILLRTSIIKSLGGYRTEFLTSEDNDLWLRMLEKNYKIAVSIKSPYLVRLSSNSATQMHKSSAKFFRELALKYANERLLLGSDPLMRNEQIDEIEFDEMSESDLEHLKNGKYFAGRTLGYQYKVNIAARDYYEIFKNIRKGLNSGWKLQETYKAIVFPILGPRLVRIGVRVKSIFK